MTEADEERRDPTGKSGQLLTEGYPSHLSHVQERKSEESFKIAPLAASDGRNETNAAHPTGAWYLTS